MIKRIKKPLPQAKTKLKARPGRKPKTAKPSKVLTKPLVDRQELFCQYYCSMGELFANGTKSYMEAYDIDASRKGAYQAAASNASRLLKDDKILARIRELLDMNGMNDEFIDKELLWVATQKAELGPKMLAIKEYNRLKSRIVEKLDLTTQGEKLNAGIFVNEDLKE